MKRHILALMGTACIAMTMATVPAMAFGHGPHGAGKGMGMFDRADANHDGKITKAEFDAQADRMFAKMDLNHDGVITRAEARQCRMMKMERRQDGMRHGPMRGAWMQPQPAMDGAPGFDHRRPDDPPYMVWHDRAPMDYSHRNDDLR